MNALAAPSAGTASGAGQEPAVTTGDAGETPAFELRQANFEGPFDLLLDLIAKHKLDITEVALSQVTDEFIAHVKAAGKHWDLEQTTSFLLVASTLLDLKAARLLPQGDVEDEEDLALLEARDLLFARLLQYRAYKQAAALFAERWAAEQRQRPRTVGLEPHHALLLPEVVITVGPEGLARLAARAMTPRPRPVVYVDHIHTPPVSVREQAGIVAELISEGLGGAGAEPFVVYARRAVGDPTNQAAAFGGVTRNDDAMLVDNLVKARVARHRIAQENQYACRGRIGAVPFKGIAMG